MSNPIDLPAYFQRVGFQVPGGRTLPAPELSTLHEIVRAHTTAIPFENLDVLLGRPIELEMGTVFRKLITDRRGGYCFEQNILLLQVLQRLGFQAKAVSARVRLQRPRDFIPPRSHVFVQVDLNGERWLADVGVGGVSLTAAIALDVDGEQATPHEPRRIVRENGRFYHQIRFGDDWEDVCEFTLEEMPPVDRELANWFTSGHPQSHFRNRLIVARAAPDGTRLTLLNNEFKIRKRDGHADTHTIASAGALLEILDQHFGLRFPAGTRFGTGDDNPWPTT